MKRLQLQRVVDDDVATFREMVEAYWRELMPAADITQDPARRAAYFQQRFRFGGESGQPYWAVADGERIGFLMAPILETENRAGVKDFYILPEERRQGVGSAMVQALYRQLDALGVHRIDLHVRRDDAEALAFWQA